MAAKKQITPRGQKVATVAFIELIAGALVYGGISAMLSDHVYGGLFALLVGIAVFVLGIRWESLAERFGDKFRTTTVAAATDVRWWLFLLLLVFGVATAPVIIDRVAGMMPPVVVQDQGSANQIVELQEALTNAIQGKSFRVPKGVPHAGSYIRLTSAPVGVIKHC